MMEKNHKILLEALQKLPVYPPADQLWNIVEKFLDASNSTSIFQKLHEKEPPPFIWANIDKELANRERSFNYQLWIKLSLSAAAILLTGFVIFHAVNTYNKHFSYFEELISRQDLIQGQEDNETVTHALKLICEAKPEACNSSEFRQMIKELEFLDQSKKAVMDQFSIYNDDRELALMLTKIELEQTEIINRMVTRAN